MSRTLVLSATLLFGPALLVGAALLVGGCEQTADDVKIGKDGSGSYSEDVSYDTAAMKGIAEALKEIEKQFPAPPGGMDGDEKKPEKTSDVDKLKKLVQAVEGVEITKYEPFEKPDRTGVHLEATFKTLEGYAKATHLEANAELKKNEDGSYTLTFSGDAPAEKKPAAEPGMGDAPAAMGDEGMAAMAAPFEPFLQSLEFGRKLTLPGTIVSTNGTKGEDGSTVSWKATWKDIKEGKAGNETVTFKGEDLDLKPFKIQRDMEALAGGGMPGGAPGGAPAGK